MLTLGFYFIAYSAKFSLDMKLSLNVELRNCRNEVIPLTQNHFFKLEILTV